MVSKTNFWASKAVTHGKARVLYDAMKKKYGLEHLPDREYRKCLDSLLTIGVADSLVACCKEEFCFDSILQTLRYSTWCQSHSEKGRFWGDGMSPREIEGLDLLYHLSSAFCWQDMG